MRYNLEFMLRLFRQRVESTPAPLGLGHLEIALMEVLWTYGELNVRGVAAHAGRRLAYTTVMTTLDRLFKKNLLSRRKQDRAFLYSPRFSRVELERQLAGDFVAGLFRSREQLVSCLVDAVGSHDETLLDDLEAEIRARRKALERQAKQ